MPHALRYIAAALLTLLLATGLGCEQLSCHGERQPERPETAASWVEETALTQFVPKTARTLAFTRDLATFGETFAFMAERLPRPEIAPARQAWSDALGVDPASPDALAELGFSVAAPTVVFYDRGFWAVGAGLDKPEVFAKKLAALATRKDLEIAESKFGTSTAIRLAHDDRTLFVTHDNQHALIAVRVDDSALGDAASLPEAWLPTSGKSRFLDRKLHREVLRELSTVGEVVGVVRPAAWLANTEAKGHAAVLLDRILSQVGPVGFSASSVSLEKAARLRILTPGEPGAATMIGDLGQAEGEIPPLGGLIEPGVLGVARLSVGPQQLYDTLLSAMPAQRRPEVDAFWDTVDKELRVDARNDILKNLRGHAVVVAYGIDSDTLGESQSHWYLDTLKLEATREAVLLPIKERKPLVDTLDALTEVSKGKLSRQAVGHTMQYAWMVDGELQWALIVADDHVLFVDSAVAFNHARAYERNARPMGPKLEEAGITRLVDPAHSAALYLDTASLTNILAEMQTDATTEWLEPFRSVLITTRTEDGMGVTDVELEIAPREN